MSSFLQFLANTKYCILCTDFHPLFFLEVEINSHSKLTAPSMLRINKLLDYVADKLHISSLHSNSSSPHSRIPTSTSANSFGAKTDPKPSGGNLLEMVCMDQVVDGNLTLMSCRHGIWKSGGDMVLYYRRRIQSPV